MMALALIPEGFDLVSPLRVRNCSFEIDSTCSDRKNEFQRLLTDLNQGTNFGILAIVTCTSSGAIKPLIANDQRETITEKNKSDGLKYCALASSVKPRDAGPITGERGSMSKIEVQRQDALEIAYGESLEPGHLGPDSVDISLYLRQIWRRGCAVGRGMHPEQLCDQRMQSPHLIGDLIHERQLNSLVNKVLEVVFRELRALCSDGSAKPRERGLAKTTKARHQCVRRLSKRPIEQHQ